MVTHCFLDCLMFPLKECHAFMAAAQRAGYSYYKAAHNTSSAPPLHTHMEDSTLELVSGVFSRRYQGVLERIPHKAWCHDTSKVLWGL